MSIIAIVINLSVSGGCGMVLIICQHRRLQKAQQQHVDEMKKLHERLRTTTSQKAALHEEVRNDMSVCVNDKKSA
jgi:hypothetical protein